MLTLGPEALRARAASSSRTCRRIPPRRSTPRCASARSSRGDRGSTAGSAAPSASAIREALAEVRLPAATRLPAPLPAPALRRPAAARLPRDGVPARPALIVLDEPTTGLDVTTQAHVLATVRELCRATTSRRSTSATTSRSSPRSRRACSSCTRAGSSRQGPAGALFASRRAPVHAPADRGDPRHLGARALIGRSRATCLRPAPADGCVFAPRCAFAIDACRATRSRRSRARGRPRGALHPRRRAARRLPRGAPARRSRRARRPSRRSLSVARLHARLRQRQVLHDVSLELAPRECLALVGESGSGKTTLARVHRGPACRDVGRRRFRGEPLAATRARPRRELCRAIQYVFQSPYNSLNPRRTIGEIVAQPLEHFFGLPRREADARVGRGARPRLARRELRRALPGRALRRRAPARRDRARARR